MPNDLDDIEALALVVPREAVAGGAGAYAYDGAEPLAALVGRTVLTANELVGAWAMLYATISGHSLPYVGSLFDRWARESVQRRQLAEMAREFLGKLPHEREQVDALLERAEELAHERDMLVAQPWSIGHLHAGAIAADETGPTHFAVQKEVMLEQAAQFELLLAALRGLRADVTELAQDFAQSRDVEKARVLRRSSVLAAEMKFGRKAARPKAGPRHKDWVPSLRA